MLTDSNTSQIARLAQGFENVNREAWLALVQKVIKGSDFAKRMTSRTWDDLLLQPLYTSLNTLPHTINALPSCEPFTRGAPNTQNRHGWDIRQLYSGSNAAKINAEILEDLSGGATSISLSMGGPNSIGIKTGELERVLEGVHLDFCPIAINASHRTLEAAENMIGLWERRDIPENKRRAHFDADPLSLLAITGSLNLPITQALENALSLVGMTSSMPCVSALTTDGHAYHCAGATEAQELAIVLGTIVSFLRAGEKKGYSPASILKKLTMTLAIDADQFLNISKLRAARLLVWRLAESMSVGVEAGSVKISAITSWRMFTKRDPWTNILRTTIACASGAMGGADSILVLPFTFALGEPDSVARRISRNIQIVCQEESHLGRVVDPCGGSWFVENLTEDLAKKAWSLFQGIERQGGLEKALLSGYLQNEIAKSASARKKAIRTCRSELTGVSAFPLLETDKVSFFERNLDTKTEGVGAISVPQLKIERLSEPFELLRDAADEHANKYGQPYKIFLASLGDVIDHNVRTTWMKNYLAAGGIHAEISEGYKDVEHLSQAFKKSGLSIVCLCSSDTVYAEYAEPAAKTLKSAGAKRVLMAGRPNDQEATLRSAGVDQFIFAGLDAIEILQDLQKKLRE
ncbi:MAG: methylmalonyl-CoA mutase subunit beta [Hyphomicrobium sp.]